MVKPEREVPFILPTTVADCVPVTSPTKVPVKVDGAVIVVFVTLVTLPFESIVTLGTAVALP